jgi:hypothetical protein
MRGRGSENLGYEALYHYAKQLRNGLPILINHQRFQLFFIEKIKVMSLLPWVEWGNSSLSCYHIDIMIFFFYW